jgi:hypothetical protein
VILGLIHGVGLFEEFHHSILARCREGSHPRPYGRGVPAVLNGQNRRFRTVCLHYPAQCKQTGLICLHWAVYPHFHCFYLPYSI